MYPDLNSRSASLYSRACEVMPGGSTRSTTYLSPYAPYARQGNGCRVIDVDGVERIDFLNNYTSLVHGHAHPHIVQAVTEQLELGACFALPTETEIRLAELLCSRVRSFERIRFTNSGTEAVMTAIKAARAYTGRSKIAKVEGAYHGTYDYAEVSLEASPDNWGEDEPASVPFAEGTPRGVLDDVVVIPLNDTEKAQQILTTYGDEFAGILVDPMPSKVGFVRASDEFVNMLHAFSRQHSSVLIFDEVMSFRLGYGGAQSEYEIAPDLTTLGKIIGGGFPVGAVAGNSDVMSVFEQSGGRAALPHGGTFNANPVTMVAGLAAMELMEPETYAKLNALGDQTRAKLRESFRTAGVPAQITGKGSLFHLHLNDRHLAEHRAVYPTAIEREAMTNLHRYLIAHGILLSPQGMGALSTPMGEEEIDRLAQTLLEGLQTLQHDELQQSRHTKPISKLRGNVK